MQQKSWPIMAPALAAAAWKAEMPGMTSTLDAVGFEIDDLIDKRRHGIDARIAGADEGHLLALLGKFDGVADAVFLAAKREAVFGLVLLQVGNEIEIEAVAHPIGCASKCLRCGGAARQSAAGADAHDVQNCHAAVPRNSRMGAGLRGNGTGCALAFGFGDDQFRIGSGSGKRRGFGHAGRSDFRHHVVRWCFQFVERVHSVLQR